MVLTQGVSDIRHCLAKQGYFQICGWNLRRDEALLYEHILVRMHGIETKKEVYAGLRHGWSQPVRA